jgi:glycosyltransferase involved in cell wall biosynthesis
VEPPDRLDPDAFRRRFGLDGPFLLYVGRIDAAKGCDALLDHYARWRARRPDAPPLVLLGRAATRLPEQPGVIQTGYLDDAEKWNALAACHALVMPSAYESLSIALLEAWSAGRPVLVNGDCEVLVQQTRRAKGGLWYRGADEFAAALDRLLEPRLADSLGGQGRRFAERHARWADVAEVYLRVADL